MNAGGRTHLEKIAARLFLVVLFLHILALCIVFPASKLATKDLPHHVDYSLWLYNSTVMNHFLKDSWQMWGYNPYVLGGYPDGAVLHHPNNTARGWQLFTFLLSPISFPLAFKLYPFLSILLVPWIVRHACKVLNLPRLEVDLISILTLIYWWSSDLWGFSSTGMISYVTVCTGSILIFAYVVAFCTSGDPLDAFKLLFLSILFLLIHPFIAILALPPSMIFYFLYFQKMRWKQRAVLVGMLPVIFLTAMPWLFATFLIHYPDSGAVNALAGHSYGWKGFIAHVFGKNGYLFLLAAGIAGFYRWFKSGKKNLALAWSGGTLFLMVLAYFGSYLPGIPLTEPSRFKSAFYLFLCLPAGSGLIAMHHWLRKPSGLRIAAVGALCILFVFLPVRAAKRAFFNPIVNGQRIITPPAPDAAKLTEWIQKNTDSGGRILFEDWADWELKYNFVPGLIAVQTQREIVGCPYADIEEHYPVFPDFVQGQLFDRPIASFTSNAMAKYLDFYNVHWGICWYPATIDYFQKHTELFAFSTSIGPFHVFKVTHPSSFFARGSGVIHATFNRIELQDLQGDDVILKYHWIPTLRSNDGSTLYEIKMLDDPVGFIGVRPNHKKLTIYNAYRISR